jgi:hypothetical protein
MLKLLVHVAGGPAWVGRPTASSLVPVRRFTCGTAASDELADAVDGSPEAPAVLLPREAFGPALGRVGTLDGVAEAVRERVNLICDRLSQAVPGIAGALAVSACSGCLENVDRMREGSERKAERRAGGGFEVAPQNAKGKARAAAASVARSQVPAKPDPRQARADSRWANAVGGVRAKKAKGRSLTLAEVKEALVEGSKVREIVEQRKPRRR